MATSSLEIVVGLRDQASGPLGGLRRALGGIGQIAGGILGAQAIGGIINGLRSMGTEALDAVASYERLTASMESLVARELRAADATLSMEEALAQAGPKAKDLVNWVEQLAIKSPFDQEGVATAMRTALAYGFTVENAQRLTKASIDFTAATGGTSQQMGQIALALGQMEAKGKLAGQEILQLTNAGVGVRGILDKMGFSLDDVSKGLVKSDEFFEAFVSTMEDDFGGAAERQSETWAGLVNTFGDLKKIGLRELFGGLFKAVQPVAATFAAWLQGDGLVKLKGWGESIGEFTGKVVNLFQAIADAGLSSPETSEALGWLLGPAMTGKLQELGTKFEPIISAIKNLISAFQESGPEISAAVAEIFSTIQSTIGTQGPGIVENFSSIINSIAELWRQHGTEIINVVSGIIQILSVVLIGGLQFLSGLVAGFLKGLTGDWDGGWALIVASTESFASAIMAMMGTTLEEVRATWQKNIEMLIIIVLLSWAKFFTAGKRIVDGIKSGISSQWSGIIAWLKGKIAELVAMVNKALLIRSPSGVFAEIGAQMMAGMAQGIQGSMGLPQMALAKGTPGAGSSSGASGRGLYIGSQNITIMNGSDIDEIMEAIKMANMQSMKTAGSFGYAG